MLEGEDHVELVAARVGDPARHLDRRAGHLADGEQVLVGEADLAVHLGEELVEARAVGRAGEGRPVRLARILGPVGQGGVLGDEVDDVHAEAVDAALDPPAHHRVDRLAHLGVLPVEVGLLRREEVEVVLTARLVEVPGGAGERGAPVVGLGARRAGLVALASRPPPVPVALGRARVARLDEPRVLVGGVVDDEVHDQPEAALVAAGDEGVEVGEGAEERVDVLVVADVVAVVVHRRAVDGREPQHVDAELGEVVEPRRDAGQVADAVSVAVGERARIDLVDDGAAPPARRPVGRATSWRRRPSRQTRVRWRRSQAGSSARSQQDPCSVVARGERRPQAVHRLTWEDGGDDDAPADRLRHPCCPATRWLDQWSGGGSAARTPTTTRR